MDENYVQLNQVNQSPVQYVPLISNLEHKSGDMDSPDVPTSSHNLPHFHRKRVIRAVIWFSVWMGLNITLSFSNKILFSKGFEFPLLIIIMGTLTTFVGSAVSIFVLKWESPQLTECYHHWKLLTAFALMHGVSAGLENLSIVYISISLNQIIKASLPAMTLLLAWLVQGERSTRGLVLATGLTVLGAVFAVFRNPELSENGHIGVITAVLSMFGAAVSTLVTGAMVQHGDRPLNGLAVAFVTSPLAAASLIPAFAVEEYPKLMATWDKAGEAQDLEGSGEGTMTTKMTQMEMVVWISAISIIAFVYNVSRLYFIKFTAAHYSVLAGNVKVLVLVLLSMAVFGRTFAPINYLGMVLSLAGFLMYNGIRFRQLRSRYK